MALPIVVDSNITGLSYTEETSLAVAATTPTFYALEPNSYSDFGAKFTATAREVINASRQKLKGSITNMEANAGFACDVTQHNIKKILQGFFFATLAETPCNIPMNGTANPITGVTVAANTTFTAAAGLATVGVVNRLVVLNGFKGALNQGLQVVNSGSASTVVVTGALTVEAAPPASATIRVVGQQGTAADLTMTVTAGIVAMVSTALDFTTLGLQVGQWIYIGGDTAITQFVNAANTGYARIGAILAHSLTFDVVLFAAVADAGTAKTVQFFFGDVLKNAPAGSIVRRTYTLERTLGNDGTGAQAEYILGAIPNELTLNVQQASKVTADLSFVGMNYQYNTGATGVMASGTRTNVPTLGEPAINTSTCVYTTRLYVVNTTTSTVTNLFAYLDSAKLVINNGIKGDDAIGCLGYIEGSANDFAVSATFTAYFATVAAIAAVLNYSSVAMNMIFAAANQGQIIDFPLLTLSNGLNKVEKNKPIQVDLTADGAMCPNGYTALMCFFEYLPTAAMPLAQVV